MGSYCSVLPNPAAPRGSSMCPCSSSCSTVSLWGCSSPARTSPVSQTGASYYRYFSLSPCLPVTLSLCHLVSLSPCHPVPLSPCLPVSLSPCLPVTLSPCHPVTLSPCLPVTLSPCHPCTMSPSHPITIQLCPSSSLDQTVQVSLVYIVRPQHACVCVSPGPR